MGTVRAAAATAAAVVLGMLGCEGADPEAEAEDVAGRTSALCADIRGFEALAWDYYNGIPVTDAAVLPPPLPAGGQTYSHTDFPLLGFFYPPGWTPFEIREPSVLGVDLIRDDGAAIWRTVSITMSGAPLPADVRAFELSQAAGFFGETSAFRTVCANRGVNDASAGSGIVTAFDNVLVRSDARTVLLNTSVTPLPGLPTSSVSVHLVSAPTAEFPQRVYDTFLAIDWQMLTGDPTGHADRDGDGWLDRFDAFPDDPSRH